MEPKFQTSFIPKKIAEDDSRNRVSISAETNIFTLAATVVFVVISLLYGGLFFYKGVIIKQVEKARQDLLDKYSFDLQKLNEQFEAQKDKDFNSYKEAKLLQDKREFDVLESENKKLKEEKKVLDKVKK